MNIKQRTFLTKFDRAIFTAGYILIGISIFISVVSPFWESAIIGLVIVGALGIVLKRHRQLKKPIFKGLTFPLLTYPCFQVPDILTNTMSHPNIFANLLLFLMICWGGFLIYLYSKTERKNWAHIVRLIKNISVCILLITGGNNQYGSFNR